MTVSLKHQFHSLKGDGTDPTKVQPSNWNEEHDILMATAKVLGRITASAGPVEEIDWTAYGRSVINAADAAALKALIGFTEADIPISATSRVIGRATAGSGGGEELTITQVLDMVGSAADGDMLVRSGGIWLRVPKGTLGQILTQGASVGAWAAASYVDPPTVHIREEQTPGTNSSSPFTGSVFNTYVLNTTKLNTISGASLGSNRITLPAGTYEARVVSSATPQASSGSSLYKGRLRDVTNSVTLVDGQTGALTATGGGAVATRMPVNINGRFTLAGSANIELQVYINNTPGQLTAISQGTEVYSDVIIKKVG